MWLPLNHKCYCNVSSKLIVSLNYWCHFLSKIKCRFLTLQEKSQTNCLQWQLWLLYFDKFACNGNSIMVVSIHFYLCFYIKHNKKVYRTGMRLMLEKPSMIQGPSNPSRSLCEKDIKLILQRDFHFHLTPQYQPSLSCKEFWANKPFPWT